MRTGIAGRVALTTSLLVLAATATVGYMVYMGARRALIQASSDRLAYTAEMIQVRFDASIEAIGKDVRFLAGTPPVHGTVRALSRWGLDPETAIMHYEWRAQLADIFTSFLESRPSYLQARFIGVADGGRELVRVERRAGTLHRASNEEFRQVERQKYFTEGIRTEPDKLYFSSVSIKSSEYGGAWKGVPIMQAATPVYTSAGRLFGLIVIDVDVRTILDGMKALVDEPRALYLAGADGEFLIRPLGPAGGAAAPVEAGLLQQAFPPADPVFHGTLGEIRLPRALIGAQTPGIAYFRRFAVHREASVEDLILGVTEPYPSILAGVRQVRNNSALITLLFGLAGIIVAMSVSRYVTEPLRDVTRAVATFGSGRSAALPVQRKDEIGILARAFDGMAHQIQQHIRTLAEEERRQRTILETSAEGILVTDAEGRVEAFNPAAERVLGYAGAEAVGMHARDLIRPLAGPVYPDAALSWLPAQQGAEAVGLRKDGGSLPLSIAWSSFELEGSLRYTVFLRDVTEQHAAAEAQARLLQALDEERAALRTLSDSLEERVKERTADLLRMNAALDLRNQELREYAHAASHDLQEPLRKLRAFADLLQREHGAGLDAGAAHYVERMCDSAERMSQLIQGLRSLHSISTQERPFEQVDLNLATREVLSDIEIYLQENEGRVEIEPLPVLEADHAQMRQLLQNLILNAVKFHRAGVPPVVHVRATIENGIEPGGLPERCRLEVEDNGIGFDEKYLDRIFSPFQRLHARDGYEGTGMGLAICRRIVERHGGAITARSTPDAGTIFVVELPCRQNAVGRFEETLEPLRSALKA